MGVRRGDPVHAAFDALEAALHEQAREECRVLEPKVQHALAQMRDAIRRDDVHGVASEEDVARIRAAIESVPGVVKCRIDSYGEADRKRDVTAFVDGGDFAALRAAVDAVIPPDLRVSIDHVPVEAREGDDP